MNRLSRIFRPIAAAGAFLVAAAFVPLHARQSPQSELRAEIGSSHIVTADPPVAHPASEPCTVQLFSGAVLAGGAPKGFEYAAPPECPGPWATVVLTGAFTLSGGAPAERLILVSIGGSNLYFGAAPSPSGSLDQMWTAQRDVTDDSALLEAPRVGQATLESASGASDTAVIIGSVRLDFYRTGVSDPAHRTPDAILPLASDAQLSKDSAAFSQSLVLPRNIERAYMDVIAAGEAADQAWYFCAPPDAGYRVGDCAGDPYREVEIAIDGESAGIAPVYPLISPDAIDARLWQPIPGLQALGIRPYRVDLTPFAGLVSDGEPHRITVGVYGITDRFVAAASLLLYFDRGSARVNGAVTVDTLDAAPVVTSSDTANGRTFGATRQFTIVGYVNTSRGKIETRLDGQAQFLNEQRAATTGSPAEHLRQSSEFSSTVSTRAGAAILKLQTQSSYSLGAEIADEAASSLPTRTDTVRQGYEDVENDSLNGVAVFTSTLREALSPSDTFPVDSGADFSGGGTSHGSQKYFYSNSAGACYSRTLVASGGVLAGVIEGQGCKRSDR